MTTSTRINRLIAVFTAPLSMPKMASGVIGSGKLSRSGGHNTSHRAADDRCGGRPGAGPPAALPRSVEHHDGPHLDGAALGAGAALGRLERLVEAVGLDHVVAAELLLGLGERPVGDDRL